MKITKLFFFATLFVFTSFKSFSQGNLQFNQVLLLSDNVVTNTNLGTVPAGKVWKIESFGGVAAQAIHGTLNGVPAGALQKTAYQSVSTASLINQNSFSLPVWLPAGTQLGYYGNLNGNIVWYSVVEFNILP